MQSVHHGTRSATLASIAAALVLLLVGCGGDVLPTAIANDVIFDYNFELQEDSYVTLTLTPLDRLAQPIVIYDREEFVSGSHEVEISTEDLPNGYYYLNLRAEGIDGDGLPTGASQQQTIVILIAHDHAAS